MSRRPDPNGESERLNGELTLALPYGALLARLCPPVYGERRDGSPARLDLGGRVPDDLGMARMFRRVALAIAAIVAILALAAAGTGALARLGSGPIGPFPGGPFPRGISDTLESTSVTDWSFVADLREVELEVNVADPRTRTTWVVVDGGQLFIPCGYPESWMKKWPAEVLADPRVRLRADGRIYELHAQRETQPERVAALAALLASKYQTGAFRSEDVWFFRLDPRPSS